jgi:hypothetical protein
MIAATKQHDSYKRNSRNYFDVFRLKLKLRRLCSHWTFQKFFPGSIQLMFQLRSGHNVGSSSEVRAVIMRPRSSVLKSISVPFSCDMLMEIDIVGMGLAPDYVSYAIRQICP